MILKRYLTRVVFISIFLQTATGCDSIKKMYEEKDDSKLAISRPMPSREIPQIGAECSFTRTWREGKMYYIFNASPLMDPSVPYDSNNSDSVSKHIRSRMFTNNMNTTYFRPKFTVQLNDKAGFKLFDIEMEDIIKIVDNDNKPVKLEQRSSITCSRDMYKSISTWDVVWRPNSLP